MFKLFAAFLIWAIRGWCTRRGRVRVIRRPAQDQQRDETGWNYGSPLQSVQGSPYLIRYALFGWLPGDKRRASWLPNIYLHNILLPDSDPAPHNHPWPWAVSLILRGWYKEERLIAGYTWEGAFLPGQVNSIHAQTFHRIAYIGCAPPDDPGVWTLFITSGGKRQPWGFAVPGLGFTPHRERKLYSKRFGEPPLEVDEKGNWIIRDENGVRL